MAGKTKLAVNGRMAVAISDGELDVDEVDGRGSDQSLNSNVSLPNVQGSTCYSERSVASWAVSFERLLQDPVGVKYFTEFLKKEFSAENILFWQACERFQQIPADDLEQLSQIAGEIYSTYLSSSSLSPINIDRQAQLEEDVLNDPRSDMFKAQQLQIFNLMKFDSYTRFVKSPLYQQCVLAEVEGRPLPGGTSLQGSQSFDHKHDQESSKKQKQKLKPGKSFSGVRQESYDKKGGNLENKMWRSTSKLSRRKEKGDSLGVDFPESNGLSLSRRESQGSVYSTASMELGYLSLTNSKNESEKVNTDIETEQKVKYCCVYLPDKTASLAMVRPGLTIRDLLSGVCERHGIPLAATSVFLAGSDKKPLVLDQDSMILCDKEVRVEKKVLFELELVPANRKLWVTAKPTKTVCEALQPFLMKYHLNVKDLEAKISGESQPLKMHSTVSCLDNQRVILDKIKEGKQYLSLTCSSEDITCKVSLDIIQKHYPGLLHSSLWNEIWTLEPADSVRILLPTESQLAYSHASTDTAEEKMNSKQPSAYLKQQEPPINANQAWESLSVNSQPIRRSRDKGTHEGRKEMYRKTYDVEALFEMLSKAQSCRVNDQRGLLKKEDLVLPDFLQLPEELAEVCLHSPESETGREKGAGYLTQPEGGAAEGDQTPGVSGEKPAPRTSTSQDTQLGDSTGTRTNV